MPNTNRTNKYFDLALLAPIVALAWPTMLEQLMQTAVQYIDTAMVGKLGRAATAAVGSTTTVGWLIGSTVTLVSEVQRMNAPLPKCTTRAGKITDARDSQPAKA